MKIVGARILETHAVSEASYCIAAGNLLASNGVPDAMTAGFLANQTAHLAERLLCGLEAGLAAGSEEGPVHSAALLVMDDQPFPLVDLRVDWDDTPPIARTRKLWQAYEGQMIDYLNRAIDPAAAPTYGVVGDP